MARILKTLVKGGKVFDGKRFVYADILTEGDTVSKIEPSISEVADFVYDASGKIVSAGLVDAHVHMRGISSDEFGIQAEMSAFPFGVTAAADASGKNGDRALLDSFMLKSVVFPAVDIKNNRADFERTKSGLSQAVQILKGIDDIGIHEFTDRDVVRHRLVQDIIKAYEKYEEVKKRK